MICASLLITVDLTRLAAGSWCHQTDRQIGEGDIAASYSAARIGMGQPIRKPFSFRGGSYVCTSRRKIGGVETVEAYLVLQKRMFDGVCRSYSAVVQDGDAARSAAEGFYHGMIVHHGSDECVLSGSPLTFTAAMIDQLGLFD